MGFFPPTGNVITPDAMKSSSPNSFLKANVPPTAASGSICFAVNASPITQLLRSETTGSLGECTHTTMQFFLGHKIHHVAVNWSIIIPTILGIFGLHNNVLRSLRVSLGRCRARPSTGGSCSPAALPLGAKSIRYLLRYFKKPFEDRAKGWPIL